MNSNLTYKARTGQQVNATATDLNTGQSKLKQPWNKTCGFYGRSALFVAGKHQSNGE